ncbi:hypothetical protein BRADI_4g27865v3 [Brachypodium distachyon]|uniref:Uncharacterized protein n=1 Tax=Brachypodium distachyon TaxID=15368 RepID=A0A2K2CQQ0_BRADI|nr:hypothetical protein BRADI_4g27865v3 [Brachypodium distachyon]
MPWPGCWALARPPMPWPGCGRGAKFPCVHFVRVFRGVVGPSRPSLLCFFSCESTHPSPTLTVSSQSCPPPHGSLTRPCSARMSACLPDGRTAPLTALPGRAAATAPTSPGREEAELCQHADAAV